MGDTQRGIHIIDTLGMREKEKEKENNRSR